MRALYWALVWSSASVCAARAVTYLPPLVALVIGVTLVGEIIGLLGYLAMIIILVGVAVLQFGSSAPAFATSRVR